jgi:hypothetical protein
VRAIDLHERGRDHASLATGPRGHPSGTAQRRHPARGLVRPMAFDWRWQTPHTQVLSVRAAVASGTENFQIPSAPDLVPDGPWAKVEGGVCAPKGFKATGAVYGAQLGAVGRM